MFPWISQYLHNRQARVKVQGHKKKLLEQGVPQDGVLSPTLFLIFIDDIIKELPRGVHGATWFCGVQKSTPALPKCASRQHWTILAGLPIDVIYLDFRKAFDRATYYEIRRLWYSR
jgi:hypothetical protein